MTISENKQVYVYQLKVWILGISPMVWRRVLVRSDSTIADLHYTIQIAIGWSDTHLNQFHIHGKDFGVHHVGGICFSDNPEQVLLSSFEFRLRERFTYEYDFGDDWIHEIRVENLLEFDPKKTYPICTGGKNAAPLEDCGGVLAYMEIRDNLKYRSLGMIDENFDNKCEEYQDSEDNLFDPDTFSRREVNNHLKQYTNGDREWLFRY